MVGASVVMIPAVPSKCSFSQFSGVARGTTAIALAGGRGVDIGGKRRHWAVLFLGGVRILSNRTSRLQFEPVRSHRAEPCSVWTVGGAYVTALTMH